MFGVVVPKESLRSNVQADREVQRGLLVGTSIRILDLTAHLFNPDDGKPILVLAFAVSF
jgi:hypothetical protein